MASKVTPKEKLVAGNKTVKKGGMKGKGGSATGMQEAQKFGKPAPFGKGGGKK